jgi:hypothetical protein
MLVLSTFIVKDLFASTNMCSYVQKNRLEELKFALLCRYANTMYLILKIS